MGGQRTRNQTVPYGEAQFKNLVLSGKLITVDDPILIKPEDFTRLENIRYRDKGVIGVPGMTALNTTVPTSGVAYPKIRSGIHYEKPNETHLLIQAFNAGFTDSLIFDNTNAFPTGGDFEGTSLHDVDSLVGSFNILPDQSVGFANGLYTLIWSGNEHRIAQFINYDPATVTKKYNYSRQLNNDLTDDANIATLYSTDAYLVPEIKFILNYEESGTPLLDSTSQQSFTNYSISRTATGKQFGSYAGNFNSSAYGKIAASSDFDISAGVWTFETFARFTNFTTVRPLCGLRVSAGNYIEMGVNTSGIPYLNLYVGGVATVGITSTGAPVTTGVNHHIEFSQDEDNFYCFVDGIPVIITSITGARMAAGNAELLVGMGYSTSYKHYGTMDHTVFYTGLCKHTNIFIPPSEAYASTAAAIALVACSRPVDGFKFYVQRANTTANSSISIYHVNSIGEWDAIDSLTDGTLVSTTTLGQTGWVTFDSTVDIAYPSIHHDINAYWYMIVFNNVTVTAGSEPQLYKMTCSMPMQHLKALWGGTPQRVDIAWQNTSSDKYRDCTAAIYERDVDVQYVYDTSEITTQYKDPSILNIGGWASNDYLIIGSFVRLQGVKFNMVKNRFNHKETQIVVCYWGGEDWVQCNNIVDTTMGEDNHNYALYRSGTVSWTVPDEALEFKRSINNDAQMYYYRINWSNGLSNTTPNVPKVDQIQTIPAQEELHTFSYIFKWQNRVVILGDYYEKRNSFRVSQYGSTSVWSGPDTYKNEVGSDEEFIAGCSIWTKYSQGNYEDAILVTNKKTYLLRGTTPKEYKLQTLDDAVNCVSANTLRTVTIVTEQGEKNVAIWLSSQGLVMCDGNAIRLIDGDIRNYFEPENSECISYSTAAAMPYADIDYTHQEYHLFFISGTGSAINTEFALDLSRNKWWEGVRTPVLYGMIPVSGSDNKKYSIGFTDTGYIERLDYGNNFDGNSIPYVLKTGDTGLGNTVMKKSIVTGLKVILAVTNSDTPITGTYFINGEPDGEEFGEFIQQGKNRINQDYVGVDRELGSFHSFQLEAKTDDVSIGFKPLCIGIAFQDVMEDTGG